MLITKSFIAGCCQSILSLGKFILSSKRPRIIFIAPQHFNRDDDGTNPYFKKFIQTCEENNISYMKLESPEYESPFPHDQAAIRVDFLFWLMMLIRKILTRIYGDSNRKADKIVAKFIKIITLGKFNAPCYITMAGLFIETFQEMYPDSVVYDLQHGIIYAGHPGYFDDNNNLSLSLNAPNCKILVWGDRFRELFKDSMLKDEWQERIKVIGYPLEKEKKSIVKIHPQNIIFSLQFTSSVEYSQLESLRDMLDEALTELDKYDYPILFKHHPRYNNEIDLSELLKKHPKVKITNQSLDNLATNCFLHITWSSTTVFEFASYGVSSFILSDERFPLGESIYYRQFKYPFFKNYSLDSVVQLIQDKDEQRMISNGIKDWYLHIYSPFQYQEVLSIITNNEK